MKPVKITYDSINREERAICAHLFRLLHENLELKAQSPFGKFLGLLNKQNLSFKITPISLSQLNYTNVAIYCEVALIRDYYEVCNKKEKEQFLNHLIQIIDKEYPNVCKSISDLIDALKNRVLPHPSRLIYNLATDIKILNNNQQNFYKALQGVFNAKPDLALTIDNILLVGEAKFTESFDSKQIKLTNLIATIWSEVLFKTLGFKKPPNYAVFKLGKSNSKQTKIKSDISWGDVLKIAKETYSKNDRSLKSLINGVDLLKK